MINFPPPQQETIQTLLSQHKDRCRKSGKPQGIDEIETVMLQIIRELGGIADFIVKNKNSADPPMLLLHSHIGHIFIHLLELMNRRDLQYTNEVHDLIFTHIDNPYRYKEGHEIPITIHFNSITRSITTFGWNLATEHNLNNAASSVITALWNIGRSLHTNPEDALVYVHNNHTPNQK